MLSNGWNRNGLIQCGIQRVGRFEEILGVRIQEMSRVDANPFLRETLNTWTSAAQPTQHCYRNANFHPHGRPSPRIPLRRQRNRQSSSLIFRFTHRSANMIVHPAWAVSVSEIALDADRYELVVRLSEHSTAAVTFAGLVIDPLSPEYSSGNNLNPTVVGSIPSRTCLLR